MARRTSDHPARFDEFGLSAFSSAHTAGRELATAPTRVHTHTHMEVEMVLLQSGEMTLEYAGVEEKIRPGELVVYWAGLPHGVVKVAPATAVHVAQVPIVDLLCTAGTSAVVDDLLGGQFLRASLSPAEAAADGLAFARWSAELASRDAQLRPIIDQEMQARLRRLLHTTTPKACPSDHQHRRTAATAKGVAKAIHYVLRHFMEQITVGDVAKAARWQRDHLMASFRRTCGVTVWEFVTRVRLAEAQRLLTTTDLPVLAICHRAGFSSTSRMYDAFRRYRNLTPSQYRRAVHRERTHASAHGGKRPAARPR